MKLGILTFSYRKLYEKGEEFEGDFSGEEFWIADFNVSPPMKIVGPFRTLKAAMIALKALIEVYEESPNDTVGFWRAVDFYEEEIKQEIKYDEYRDQSLSIGTDYGM